MERSDNPTSLYKISELNERMAFMLDVKKLTILRYLAWGLVIGWIGSYFLVKYFVIGNIGKYMCFQKLFGASFIYESIDMYGNTYVKQYYGYVAELLALPIIGIILGLAVGISNYSLRTSFFAILGGVLTGCVVPYFYSDLVIDPFFSKIYQTCFFGMLHQ